MAVVESVQGAQDLAARDRSLQEEEPYNLVLTSTDRAGNEEQVFRATLMQVVTEVFTTKGITMTATEQAAVAATVKELAKTYAWLNPQEEASVPADQADYGFLDRLWQLQVPHLVLKPGGKRVSEFKTAAVIQADLQKSVEALGRLLQGVDKPVEALRFLKGLIQAETFVPSLKDSFKSAQFWRESVELGVTVAKLNPVTTDVSAGDAAGTFLNTLWRQGNTKEAQSGLGQFFGGLKTTQERVKSLEFADRLIDAAQLTTTLGSQKTDAKFLSQLVGLGGSYASLKPVTATGQGSIPNSFLTIVWQTQSQQGLQNGAVKMNEFSTKAILEYERQTLKEMMRIPALKEQLKNLDFFNSIFISSRYFATGEETDDLTALLAATEAVEDTSVAANKSLDASSDAVVKILKASANGKYPGRDHDYWKNSISPATQAYTDFYLFFIKPLNLEWKQTGPVSYTDLPDGTRVNARPISGRQTKFAPTVEAIKRPSGADPNYLKMRYLLPGVSLP